jgi:putative hemolysin
VTATSSESAYKVLLTRDRAWVEAAQRLRSKVYTEEFGSVFALTDPGLDRDYFDAFCDHLLIWHEASREVVGCYRMLGPDSAREAGRHYSEHMFDLSGHAALQPDLLEIGRLCIDPAHRNGTVIAMLWSAVAQQAAQRGCRWVGGSYSTSLLDGGSMAADTWEIVSRSYLAPRPLGVKPIEPWSAAASVDHARQPVLPPLLRAYLRLGAWVCGEPAYDHGLRTADFYLLLDLNRMNSRLLRRFTEAARNEVG